MWTYATLIRPGPSTYFLVYRSQPDQALKAQLTTAAPCRDSPLVHHHVLPKIKTKESPEEEEAKKDQNSYFSLFNGFINLEEIGQVKNCLTQDFTLWEIPKMPRFEQSDRTAYVRLTSELLENASSLLSAYRQLQARSEAYPLLSWREVSEWAKDINAVDARWYTVPQLETDYSLSKTPERQK